MTNTPQQAPRQQGVRRTVRVLAPVLALLVTSLTGALSAAYADAPDTWANNPPVSPLQVLLVIVIIPAGLFALITLLVYLPSMSRAEKYQPGQAWRGEATWFGGPPAMFKGWLDRVWVEGVAFDKVAE